MQLLQPELISEMTLLIITKFFTFRQVDLQAWEEDEDEWEIREEGGGDTWEFEIRPCAERLFMDLVINFQSLLNDSLVSLKVTILETLKCWILLTLHPTQIQLFQSFAGNVQQDIVRKDAVYTALGLSSNVIFKSFGKFQVSQPVKE
jgi:hypothetical protein